MLMSIDLVCPQNSPDNSFYSGQQSVWRCKTGQLAENKRVSAQYPVEQLYEPLSSPLDSSRPRDHPREGPRKYAK